MRSLGLESARSPFDIVPKVSASITRSTGLITLGHGSREETKTMTKGPNPSLGNAFSEANTTKTPSAFYSKVAEVSIIFIQISGKVKVNERGERCRNFVFLPGCQFL